MGRLQPPIILVQNKETDLDDQLREQVEAFFASKKLALEVIVLQSRDSEVSYTKTEQPNLVLVLGGDGTFLRAAREFVNHNVPLIGINTGHLGFLTRIEAHRLEDSLQAIVEGDTTIEARMMLDVTTSKASEPPHVALNDVVVKNTDPTRLAKLIVTINGEMLADYDADGLIFCTPTGSTAYNLSAGGPILEPHSEVIAMTPICPHSLGAKPIVFPKDTMITLQSDPRNIAPLVCAADGHDICTLAPGETMQVAKSDKSLKMVSFQAQESFYALLKRKLAWGANPRGLPLSEESSATV